MKDENKNIDVLVKNIQKSVDLMLRGILSPLNCGRNEKLFDINKIVNKK